MEFQGNMKWDGEKVCRGCQREKERERERKAAFVRIKIFLHYEHGNYIFNFHVSICSELSWKWAFQNNSLFQLKCAFFRKLKINLIWSTFFSSDSMVISSHLEIQHCDMIEREFSHTCCSCAVVSFYFWSLDQHILHAMSEMICKLDGTHSCPLLHLQPHTQTYTCIAHFLRVYIRKLHQINRKLESSVTFTLLGPQIVLLDINFNIIGLSI